MSYVGNEPQTQSLAQDLFSGDGSTTGFTLSHKPGSATAVIVQVGGVLQVASQGYTVSGGTINFTSAPPTGTNNISVVHLGVEVQVPTPADGSVTAAKMASGEIPFANSFTSAEQTISGAGLLTLSHGLGSSPSLIQLRFICKIAEHGYSIGDEIIFPHGHYATTTSTGYGLAVYIEDSTNVNVRFGSQAAPLIFTHKTTGAQVILTNANWRLIVRAWA